MKKAIYQQEVEKIIQAIQSGVKPWVAPFDQPSIGRPHNFLTKTRYSGANSILLSMIAYSRGYASNAWLTFRQVNELKGKVKKGAAAARIFFFTYVEKKNEEEGESDQELKKVPRWKCYNVFNLAQTEGIEYENTRIPSSDPLVVNALVADLALQSKAVIRHSYRKEAFYHFEDDYIHLPHQQYFHTAAGYDATLLHELVHWTGHQSRLDRLASIKRFGDAAYSFEELVAELGAAFLAVDLNVRSDIENHASYLNDWTTLLSDKHMAFFKAASLAEKAVDYLYSLTKDAERPFILEVA